MTTTYPAPVESLIAERVYQPQYDSYLLVDTMRRSGLIPQRRVLDLCTGSGFVAISAAEMGCASVTAYDICPSAVMYSRGNAAGAGVDVDVRQGSWVKALDHGPYDVVVSNPPYVPTPPLDDTGTIASIAGPSRAYNAGPDGRLVLDPLCGSASKLLADGGSLLLVHSALAGVEQTVQSLRDTGLKADVVASQLIPFGPVLTARAQWLEETGRIGRGCRKEQIVVIRADKP
ncbi:MULTISPECIES: HemK2/MTQ2 family protein methyltransferase [unclassified Mycobacterium]|uniref:HemK2/MTQ2 family protein methyltransferase n=1 Tax=unclassified Mycobacterium TaxID=2642494 RepID=UPI002740DFDC|nr:MULTISPECIES: HemK2/MTQ2 family protein methyltransferase [unclassified Mycobacterium]MDP7706416.1 class I SAM-dependent methyltransferase [Mycobacterium sp. TY815]MDP7725811.1 class I SAM-dependent methyltransferase [Mycobacterium sp. TY814]